jgi:CheY-like chemotaxis protein
MLGEGLVPSQPTILIVDDDPDTRDVLAEMLRASGYEAATAEDGATAMRYLDAGNHPQAIVLDLHMPGMSGDTFLRRMREDVALAAIPVIAFTGDGGEPPDGIAAFVRKASDDPDVLLDAIASCLKVA